MIPEFRAKKVDSDEYVCGFLYQDIIEYIKSDGLNPDEYKKALDKESWYIMDNLSRTDMIDKSTLAIHFPDMIDSQGNKIFASLQEDGKGGDMFKHSVNCRLDSPRPHDGTYWISCESPLVYKDFGFYLKYNVIDSTPKYADGKITNRKGFASFEKNLEFIGIQECQKSKNGK